MDREYRVRVSVADGLPGLIPFTFDLPAQDRDEAIKIVRRHVRRRSGGKQVVREVHSARLAPWASRQRGKYPDPYNTGQVH